MQTITVNLPYDINVGDFEHLAIDVLAELTRLLPSEATDKANPVVLLCGLFPTTEGAVGFISTLQSCDCPPLPFLEWVVEAVDEGMPTEAYEAQVSLSFSLDDAQAVLLKGAWPSTLPRLTVCEAA